VREHTPADSIVLAALSKRARDLLNEFHMRPANQWDRIDRLIEELSAIVDDLKALHRNGGKEKPIATRGQQ
jgi:hypothetical protein